MKKRVLKLISIPIALAVSPFLFVFAYLLLGISPLEWIEKYLDYLEN